LPLAPEPAFVGHGGLPGTRKRAWIPPYDTPQPYRPVDGHPSRRKGQWVYPGRLRVKPLCGKPVKISRAGPSPAAIRLPSPPSGPSRLGAYRALAWALPGVSGRPHGPGAWSSPGSRPVVMIHPPGWAAAPAVGPPPGRPPESPGTYSLGPTRCPPELNTLHQDRPTARSRTPHGRSALSICVGVDGSHNGCQFLGFSSLNGPQPRPRRGAGLGQPGRPRPSPASKIAGLESPRTLRMFSFALCETCLRESATSRAVL